MFRSLRLLLASNDEKLDHQLSAFLHAEGHHLVSCSDVREAMVRLRTDRPYDGVVLDLGRDRLRQPRVLEDLVRLSGKNALWLIAPLGSSDWDRDVERLGITQIVRGPLLAHDMERITAALMLQAEQHCEPAQNYDFSKADQPGCMLEELPQGRYFLAGCPAMKKIYSTVRLLAPVDVPVLILGESGVGKDVVASLLHKHSLRSQETCLSLNCAALPPDLLESELFGYEAGAFTGALKAKPGKFELAHRGTLLLDEIGEMTAPMQAKLLHVLQDGHYSRLGARVTTQVDVRVIAATNVNMESAIADSSFRQDLYYRISTFTVSIPPLRERREEIPYMVDEMMRRLATKFQRDPVYIPPALMDLMQEYAWPGNLRELSNVLVRIAILQNTEAATLELADKVRELREGRVAAGSPAAYDGGLKSGVENMRAIVRNFKDHTESRLIQQALDAARWNRRHAAAELRISYRSLLYKIDQYQLRDTTAPLRLTSRE